MSRSARDYVNSLRDKSQGDSNARPDTTKTIETNQRIGLYDIPPDHPDSLEYANGPRRTRPTANSAQYRAVRARDEQRRQRSNDTRARNASLRRSQTAEPASQVDPAGDEPGQPDQRDEEEVCGITQRGRSRTIHTLQQSPSPEPTGAESIRSTQAPGQSQYTYKYETLDHEGLVNCAQEEFGLDLRGCETQTIIDRIRLAAAEQAPQVGSARRSTSIVLLPSTPFRVGGGWSQEVTASSQPPGPQVKRSSDAAELSDGSSKRQRKYVVVDEDTATEPETEDEAFGNAESARMAAKQILPARAAATTQANPRFPRTGSEAPPPSLQPTPSTDLDLQPSNASSHSLGGSLPRHGVSLDPSGQNSSMVAQPPSDDRSTPTEIGKLPRLLTPVIGPVHARLRKKLLSRALYGTDHGPADEVDGLHSSDIDEVPETDFGSTANTPHPAPQQQQPSSNSRTYRGRRSHVQSEPQANRHVEPTEDGDLADDEPTQASASNLTPSQLVRRERARAFAAKAHEEMAEMAPRRRLVATAPQPPTSRPQNRPPPRGDSASVQRMGGVSRRLDPVSAAREDMIAFNRAVAQGEATSFIESVTRQSEHTARRAAPLSRPADELLHDDEEMLAQAEAYAKRKWPQRSHRIRKPKPLARDFSGLERQILIMAKVHLFAYALVEGVYQTRATYLRWAALVHQATWEMELPDHPYKAPPPEVLEILVNAIATLRGKVKERLREFVARVSGFRHTTTNKKIIEKNLIRFNRLYPNSFHCKASCILSISHAIDPRSGDYESTEIAHCIALALFHGPNSVGVLYPDYFREMPLTVVAFALAIWQFCIEEWANGWRQNGDLGMAAMSDKYEAQISGLKKLREVAPRRMNRLQSQWKEYIAEYSGAVFEPEDEATLFAPNSQIRPDTPEPTAISVEEMNARLFEAARQESIRTHMQELTAEELAQPIDAGENGSDGSITPRSPSPEHNEYNTHGVLTARSKGKGRAE